MSQKSKFQTNQRSLTRNRLGKTSLQKPRKLGGGRVNPSSTQRSPVLSQSQRPVNVQGQGHSHIVLLSHSLCYKFVLYNLSFSMCEKLMEMNCFCRGEQQRRNDVSKCEMFLKVLFNNKEVSRTSSK